MSMVRPGLAQILMNGMQAVRGLSMSTGKPAVSVQSLPGLVAFAREVLVVPTSRADLPGARMPCRAGAVLDADGRRRTRTAAA